MAIENNDSNRPENSYGVAFKNTRKRTTNHPDYTGNAEISGKNFYVSGWVKPGKEGKADYLSLSFTEVQADQVEAADITADGTGTVDAETASQNSIFGEQASAE